MQVEESTKPFEFRYGDPDYKSNLALRYCGRIYFVHRDVVAIASPVVRASLESEPTKAELNLPIIKDATPDSLDLFLKLVYRQACELEPETVMGVAAIAHWMNAAPIQKLCEDYMIASEREICYEDSVTACIDFKFNRYQSKFVCALASELMSKDYDREWVSRMLTKCARSKSSEFVTEILGAVLTLVRQDEVETSD